MSEGYDKDWKTVQSISCLEPGSQTRQQNVTYVPDRNPRHFIYCFSSDNYSVLDSFALRTCLICAKHEGFSVPLHACSLPWMPHP